VVATDENNCEVEAVIFDVVASLNEFPFSSSEFIVSPNPATTILTIQHHSNEHNFAITVLNAIGFAVQPETVNSKQETCTVDISSLKPGMYLLEISEAGKQPYMFKFSVQR